jgi:hypothetical protein
MMISGLGGLNLDLFRVNDKWCIELPFILAGDKGFAEGEEDVLFGKPEMVSCDL